MYFWFGALFLFMSGYIPGLRAQGWRDPLESKQHDVYSITMRMPQAVSDRPDALVCTGRPLDPEETYIVKFTPHASKTTAHHMMVYGCNIPANFNQTWTCDQDEIHISDRSVCGDDMRQILFAWAMDAPEKSLPEGVGLRVSGDTDIKYLVLQLHYARSFEPGETDSSGVTLDMTHHRPPQQAGYLILGDWGFIPPQMPVYHLDSACIYDRNYTIYPIGFRTHSHNLGVVTSAYRVRDGEWMEIGRMSPQLPQTFYDVTHPGMEIRPGDVLTGRCTMNSMDRWTSTGMGPTNHDEMCNFYIMYSTYDQENLRTDYCFSNAEEYNWLDDFSPDEIPKTAGSLEGIEGADEVRAKFRWS